MNKILKTLTALVTFGLCLTALGTDVHFDLNKFNANPANGRTVTMQPLQPFPGNLITNVSDDSGEFTFSNAKVADYYVSIRAAGASGRIDFQITVTATNLGTVEADTITSQLGIQTYPTAGKSSWTIEAADQRYQYAGTVLSNTFYPLFSNPSNYVTAAITNGLAGPSVTNGLTPITLLNSASNALQSQIVSGATTLAQVTNVAVFVSNTTSNLLYGNVLSQVNITSNFLAATSQTIANTTSNLVYGNSVVQINTTSNLLQGNIATLGGNLTNDVNTTSNSIIVSSQVIANTTSNFLQTGINALGSNLTNDVNTTSNSLVTTSQTIDNTTSNALQTGINTLGGNLTNNVNSTSNTLQTAVATLGSNTTNAINSSSNVLAAANSSTSNALQVAKVDVTGGFSTNEFLKTATATNLVANGASVVTGTSRWATTNALGILFPLFFDWNSAGSDFGAISHSSTVWSFAHTNLSTASGSLGMTSDGMTKSANVSSSSANLANIGFQWLLYPFGGSQNFYMQLTTNGLWATNFSGDGSGLLNTSSSNLQAQALAQVTNVANSLAIIAQGITNAYGTNFPNGLVAGQRLYYPTNDPTIASNWFQASKVSSTNGFGVSPTFTNTIALEGIIALGPLGNNPAIISSTNVIIALGAGTSIATNGAFCWDSTLGQYTNWVTGSVYTNNGSAWLLQFPLGTTLYSVSGANPAGASSAVGGSLPAPNMVVGAYIDGNRLPIFGPLSTTNTMAISNSIVQNVTNIVSAGYVKSQSGFSTNQYLDSPYETNWTSPEQHFFQYAANGQWNTNAGGAGFGAAVLSGTTNRIFNHGGSVIAGGVYNKVLGFGRNWGAILGGLSNSVDSGDATSIVGGTMNNTVLSYYDVIGGGQFNTMNSAQWASILGGYYNTNNTTGGAILGGQSNRMTGNWSLAFAQNAQINHADNWVFSDTPVSTQTNSQMIVQGTNGLYLNGPLFLNAYNTNSGMYILSNAPFSLYAVTNAQPNFSHWIGNSNGVTVDIYMSNGVPIMKNIWQ